MEEVENNIKEIFERYDDGIENQRTLNHLLEEIHEGFNVYKSGIVLKNYNEKLIESTIIKDKDLIKKLNDFLNEYSDQILSLDHRNILEEQILKHMDNEYGGIDTDFFSNVIITLITEFGLKNNNCSFKNRIINKLIKSVEKVYEQDLSLNTEVASNGLNNSLHISMNAFKNTEKIIEFLLKSNDYDDHHKTFEDIFKEIQEIDDYLIKSFFEYCFLKHSKYYYENKSI